MVNRLLLIIAVLAVLGDEAAWCGLGEDAMTLIIAGDPDRALDVAQPAAEEGDVVAQYAMALIHKDKGPIRDDAEAAKWSQTAWKSALSGAKNGDPRSQFVLGGLHRAGIGVEKNEGESEAWWIKASTRGYAPAQFTLARSLRTGAGGAKDDEQRVVWFKKSAEQWFAPAQHELGTAYRDGRGVSKDERQALSWLRKAAERGFAPAQASLGYMYLEGRGTAKDDIQAVAWFKQSAKQGWAPAQYGMGALYLSGRGVAKDEREAAAWFRKAVKSGYLAAQDQLERLVKSEPQEEPGPPARSRKVARAEHRAARVARAVPVMRLPPVAPALTAEPEKPVAPPQQVVSAPPAEPEPPVEPSPPVRPESSRRAASLAVSWDDFEANYSRICRPGAAFPIPPEFDIYPTREERRYECDDGYMSVVGLGSDIFQIDSPVSWRKSSVLGIDLGMTIRGALFAGYMTANNIRGGESRGKTPKAFFAFAAKQSEAVQRGLGKTPAARFDVSFGDLSFVFWFDRADGAVLHVLTLPAENLRAIKSLKPR